MPLAFLADFKVGATFPDLDDGDFLVIHLSRLGIQDGFSTCQERPRELRCSYAQLVAQDNKVPQPKNKRCTFHVQWTPTAKQHQIVISQANLKHNHRLELLQDCRAKLKRVEERDIALRFTGDDEDPGVLGHALDFLGNLKIKADRLPSRSSPLYHELHAQQEELVAAIAKYVGKAEAIRVETEARDEGPEERNSDDIEQRTTRSGKTVATPSVTTMAKPIAESITARKRGASAAPNTSESTKSTAESKRRKISASARTGEVEVLELSDDDSAGEEASAPFSFGAGDDEVKPRPAVHAPAPKTGHEELRAASESLKKLLFNVPSSNKFNRYLPLFQHPKISITTAQELLECASTEARLEDLLQELQRDRIKPDVCGMPAIWAKALGAFLEEERRA